MVSSKKKTEIILDYLIKNNLNKKSLNNFFSPIGLDLNAKTPEQIALSILSEIVMLENNGTGMQKGIQLKKMTKPVYLDNQATTPVDLEVLKSMLPFYEQKFGNASSIHHIYGQECKKVVEQSRKVLAKGLGGDKRNLIFTSGATESINLGIRCNGEI